MPRPHYEISPVPGSLAFGSVTGTTPGTANTIVTTTSDHKIVLVLNSLNADVMLTYNGSDWVPLPAGTPFSVDMSPNERCLRAGKIIGIYYLASAPTSGRIGVSLM